MGYQNKNRPSSKKLLKSDIKFDFIDLSVDVTNNNLTKEELLEAILFIEETFFLLMKKQKKKKS